jgi:hypothetical protein
MTRPFALTAYMNSGGSFATMASILSHRDQERALDGVNGVRKAVSLDGLLLEWSLDSAHARDPREDRPSGGRPESAVESPGFALIPPRVLDLEPARLGAVAVGRGPVFEDDPSRRPSSIASTSPLHGSTSGDSSRRVRTAARAARAALGVPAPAGRGGRRRQGPGRRTRRTRACRGAPWEPQSATSWGVTAGSTSGIDTRR